jgi:septal ring factor EnvC (AmiA/AmiB activator)
VLFCGIGTDYVRAVPCHAVPCCVQVAASVEDQLAAARASIEALSAQRQQQEQTVDKLQDAFRQMLTIR